MGKILPYNQQIRPEQPNIPAVPDSLARYASGLSLIGEGLTHVSQTLSNIQQEFVQAQDAANYLKLQIAYTKKTGELAAELENNDNPAKMSEEYEKRSSALINELLEPYAVSGKMSARGLDYARNRLLLDAQDNKIRMTTIARRRIVDDAVIGLDQYYWQELANRLKSGDSNVDVFISDFAKKVNAITIGQNSDADLGGNIPANILTPKQAYEIIEKYREHATRVLTKAQEVSAKKTFEGHLVSIAATDGWDSAISFLSDQKTVKKFMDDNGLSLSDMTGSLDELKKFAELKRSEDKEALRASREKIGNEIYKAIEANDFIKARDIISTSNLEPTGENSRVYWTNILTAKAKAIANESPTPIPSQIEAEKIITDVRKGVLPLNNALSSLSKIKDVKGDDMEAYIKRAFSENQEREKSPLSYNQNRALDVIDRFRQTRISLATAKVTGSSGKIKDDDVPKLEFEKQRIEMDTLKISNTFIQWVKDNPQATDEQVEKKLQFLTRSSAEEITLNWFEKLFSKEDMEKEIIVNKKIKELKNRGIWDKMSEKEQKTAEAGFRHGESVEEIERLLYAD